MTLQVLLFAGVREMASADCVMVELSVGATYSDLLARLADQLPSARAAIESSRLAADGEFVDLESPAAEKQEIALIPPVSGG